MQKIDDDIGDGENKEETSHRINKDVNLLKFDSKAFDKPTNHDQGRDIRKER